MNKKGQALVEFVIILPIFLVLVLGVIDVGKILYHRATLEGEITDVVSLYVSGKNKEEIMEDLNLQDVTIEIDEDEEYIEFHLIKEIELVTPGLNLIFDNPYQLDVNRSISNE